MEVINMHISDNLVKLRETLNISQGELGKKINVSRFSISNYESGKRNLTDRVIQDICREFNVNENWLRYNMGEMFIHNTDEEIESLGKTYNLNQADKAFIKVFSKDLSELERKVIFDFFIKVTNEIK